MILSNQQYENFLEDVRSNLLRQHDRVSPDCKLYVAQATLLQIELLPRHFYWVFQFLLNFILFILTCTPRRLDRSVLRLLKKCPGFSAVIYYHEKVAAAAELEFYSNGKISI